MELVRGTKITDYCNQHNLSTRARHDLFSLTSVLLQEHMFAEVETAQREALAIQRKSPGTDPQDIAKSLSNLGHALRALGRLVADPPHRRQVEAA